MMPLGQALAQAMQEVHFSRSTWATPLTMCMASNWQALTQVPRPMQENWQALGPLLPKRIAATQSAGPSYSKKFLAVSQLPEQGT